MAQITDITPQVKDKTRCNIELDGRFFCGMKLETAVKYRLKKGMQISEEELSRIQCESERLTALDKALSYLSSSMKTQKQVRDYLARKGFLPEVCDFVIEKLLEYGYLHDGEYSLAYVNSEGKRKGRRLLASQLRKRGVAEEEIGAALDSLQDEEQTARSVLEKYLRGKECDQKTLRKAYSYLIGKGFDYEIARSAIQSIGAEDE